MSEKIDKIYDVIKPTFFWVPWHTVCNFKYVMFGDVLDWRQWWTDNWRLESWYATKLAYEWGCYRKPIEEQSKECIDFVYSLIE